MRESRKGFELSMNFIIVLIVSIVIFIGGLSLINETMSWAQDRKEQLNQETEDEINKLLNDGSRVALPQNKKTLDKGERTVVGLGLYNVMGGEEDFTVKLEMDEAYYENGSEMGTSDYDTGYIDKNWIYANSTKEYTLEKNEEKTIPLFIRAHPNDASDSSTESDGLYAFNLHVRTEDGNYYDGHVHKIYVKVD